MTPKSSISGMHIFIDESGTFTRSAGPSSVSAVGALIVADGRLPRIVKKYNSIRVNLPMEKGEVKGRRLSEPQVDRIVSMLAKNEVIFEVSIVDLAMSTESDTATHQNEQAKLLTANLTDEHNDAAKEFAHGLRARLMRTSAQLYVQSLVTFSVIPRVLTHATVYFAQRQPRELSAFHWVVDGKDRSRVTDWEDWWSVFVVPWLQSFALKEPMPILEGADYSHFRRFDTQLPGYLEHLFAGRGDEQVTDIGKLMQESFRFSADVESGLELVDIVTNATRRALTGNLKFAGWRNIPRLMIHRREPYIELLTMAQTAILRPPYEVTVRHFQNGGRSMLVPRRSPT